MSSWYVGLSLVVDVVLYVCLSILWSMSSWYVCLSLVVHVVLVCVSLPCRACRPGMLFALH